MKKFAKNLFKGMLLAAVILLGPDLLFAAEQEQAQRLVTLDKVAAKLKRQFRTGELTDRQYWARISALQLRYVEHTGKPDSSLLQAQAYFLADEAFPISAARLAVEALRSASAPFSRDLQPSWRILSRIARTEQISDMLISLADKFKGAGESPAGFGRDWNYYLGMAHQEAGAKDLAVEHFKKLQSGDRLYFPAVFELAMARIESDDVDGGMKLLAQLTDRSNSRRNPMDRARLAKLVDYAHLNIARLNYEKAEYVDSVRSYRNVRRTSPLFYDSLFEQSWALFMGGHPNHALGTLYAVESPFFAQRYNPEVPILRSMVFYWLCRYEDSRTALAEFLSEYAKPVKELEAFLARSKNDSDEAYRLFENLVSGVSETSLGMNRSLLTSAAVGDSMLLARDRLASLMKEQQGFSKSKNLAGLRATKELVKTVDAWIVEAKKEVGSAFLRELGTKMGHYANLRGQADFLYVELLMSEKEQILGRELHADGKMSEDRSRNKVKGWGRNTQSWAANSLEEYWWDEIGYHIFDVEPLCKLKDEQATAGL